MRLPVDARFAGLAIGLSAVALAGCSLIPGGRAHPAALAAAPANAAPSNGPAADYPMVLGDPFTVDGQLYTPADTLNYDAVGYAALDQGAGVTVAHRTLPLPSYVEVTSLDSGKTILARVERRGPMAGSQLVALSPAAAAQLGAGDGAPVRVRRVNPQEALRAELRAGRPAPAPIETPKALVEVLRRKLPATGAALLAAPAAAKPAGVAAAAPSAMPSAAPSPRRAEPQAASAYPLHVAAPAAPAPAAIHHREPAAMPVAFDLAKPKPPVAAPASKPAVAATTAPRPAVAPGVKDGFVIQAGTFSSRANAQRAATAIGGYVSPAGKLFRVRTGPFASRGQAEAALAKVRSAGYSDARVYTAG
jgi:rare lipoprotein A